MIMVNDRLCDLSLFIKEMVVLAVPNMSIAMNMGGSEGVEDNVIVQKERRRKTQEQRKNNARTTSGI